MWGSFDIIFTELPAGPLAGDIGIPPYPEPLPFWALGSESSAPQIATVDGVPGLTAAAGAQFDLAAQAQVLEDGGRCAAAVKIPSAAELTAVLGVSCEGSGGGKYPYTGGLIMTLTSPAAGAATVSVTTAADQAIAALTAGDIVFLTTELASTRRFFTVGIWSTSPPITGGTPDLYARTIDCSAFDPAHPLLGPCYPHLGGSGAVQFYEWCADTHPLVNSSGGPPIRRPELVYTIAQHSRRLRRLEVVGVGAVKRHVFLFFTADGSLPVNWTDTARDLQIGSATLDSAGALTYTLNGDAVSLPISLTAGDRLLVTAAGTTSTGLGVTLSETIPL